MTPVLSIVGKSDSGKTTLIEKILPELKKRGYKIGVIKHTAHGFEMDKKGKDSWRHQNAGADTVMVASEDRIAMVKKQPSTHLTSLMAYFEDVDLVITEGYKQETLPKIEVFRRSAHKTPIFAGHKELIAMVADIPVEGVATRFGLEDVCGITDFIEHEFLKPRTAKETK